MPSIRNRLVYIYRLATMLSIALLCVSPTAVRAGKLTAVADTISSPVPGTTSNHFVQFATPDNIPASGKIIFTPEAGQFSIPAGLDYTDVDFSINTLDIPVAATPGTGSGSAVGVTVVSGSSGSITITLNDTDSITAGDTIWVLIGLNAIVGSAGDQQITNPGSIGSYNEIVTTKNASNVTIDSSTIQIALVNPVGITGDGTTNAVENPDISPNGGSFTNSVSVTISTVTAGTTIYYTTDGTSPTTSSNIYTTPLTITTTTTIKAFATKPSYGDSGTTTATFTITTPPPAPNPPPTSGGGGGGGGGTTTIVYQPPASGGCDQLRADLNCDGHVNLVDLSILLYNWGKVKNNPRADINKDGVVNLVDFSILLFEWTN